ncbi:MAG: tRNA (adenosine(37)-N6)-threonylcarbamoyltransferase complex ATPase subunit type 1 TsaE [Pseudomonadaceae bacterium]|nr:tRNA (adenosine(37)-N6)-threonylcarbamoyltransferase complex ATPase subunit type 1 TsaE [Pseudomonadaceae bacterium]
MTHTPSPWMHPTLTFALPDQTATEALAKLVARFCVTGDLIRLEGDLGAGKSTFAAALMQTLGHTGDVPSPTYTLVQTYDDTRLPVAHVDCYRLNTPEELDGLGLEAYRSHGLIVAEWPEKGGHLLRADQPDMLTYHMGEMNNCGVLTLAFAAGDTPTARTVTLTSSRSWQRRIGFWQGINPALCRMASAPLCRDSTEEGRKAFLDGCDLGDYTIESLGGDWSFRSYWRIRLPDGSTRMLMDSPPPVEGTEEFLAAAKNYQAMGLRAPRIDAADTVNGYILSEDFGDRSLAKLVQSSADATAWYKVAADVLVTSCRHTPQQGRLYNATDWWIEAARFTDWYLPLARGHATPPEERAHFQKLWAEVMPLVMALPKGLMMFDYQATNMLLLGDEPKLENFGLIDIQDARVAPLVQDMAILLRDIRRPDNDALEAEIVTYVAERLELDRSQLQLGLEVANLHHCSRILGGLSRLAMRDGRTAGAAKFIPITWHMAHKSYGCPELKALVDFMAPWEDQGNQALQQLAKAA